MQVALMVPCYVDLFYPEVGVAALELLEKLEVDVVYPFDQTCCGQPMANSGCFQEAQATEELFIRNFSAFDHIVTPSGSCTHHLRNKFTAVPDSTERRRISTSVYDLVEFLHDVLQVREFPWAKFHHKVAFHTSCSAIYKPAYGSDQSFPRGRRSVVQQPFHEDVHEHAGTGAGRS